MITGKSQFSLNILGINDENMEIQAAAASSLFYGLEIASELVIEVLYNVLIHQQSIFNCLSTPVIRLAQSENDDVKYTGLLCFVQFAAKMYQFINTSINPIAIVSNLI